MFDKTWYGSYPNPVTKLFAGYANIFAEKKMWVAFAATRICVSKNTYELILYLLEQLTFWPLTSSLDKRCFKQLGHEKIAHLYTHMFIYSILLYFLYIFGRP